MKAVSVFREHERVELCDLRIYGEKRAQIESLGIREGACAEIFFKDRQRIVLKLEKTKVALSEDVARNILAESAGTFKES